MRNRQNEKFVGAWLSPEEYKYLMQQKEICGLSVSSMIRSWINGENLQPKPPEVYADLLRQLAGIGNNLNQIAHVANSKQDISSDSLEEAIRLARQAWRLVKETL